MNLTRYQGLLTLLGQDYADATTTVEERLRRAREYVDSRLHRAEVVQSLPQNAPVGKLLVTPGSTDIYVGTGATTPLRRIPTQAL